MIRVGLIGEDPNDTSSIRNLLQQRFAEVQFKTLLKGVRGCQLNSPKLESSLKTELKTGEFKCLIYIRDLDGFGTERQKVDELQMRFDKLKKEFKQEMFFMLNIWELEALIFADIDTFNALYKTAYKFKGDVSKIKDPKGKLKRLSSKGNKVFRESHCPEIFAQMNVNTVEKNCRYFSLFLNEVKSSLIS